MSVAGLCQICGHARAHERCNRCGTVVCGEHHDAEFGFCTECAGQYRGSGRRV